jgi:hypothetical protein
MSPHVKIVQIKGFPPFLATVYPPHDPTEQELKALTFPQHARSTKRTRVLEGERGNGIYDVARYKEEHA